VSGGISNTRWASATTYRYLGFVNGLTGTKDQSLNKKTMTVLWLASRKKATLKANG
jgi:hypothetical protein